MKHYDVIVLGLGAMGSATTYHLARAGHRVLGLDAYPQGHAFGSSHGDHRMIRRSHPDARMRPLVDRAFELWHELQDDSGDDLLQIYGEVTIQPAAAAAAPGIGPGVRSIPEIVDEDDLARTFPGFRVPKSLVATYEREAGLLRPEVAVAAHLRLARNHGANIQRPERVHRWGPDGTGVTVTTDHADYRADRLVLTAGPWAPQELARLGLPLSVVRIVNVYFEPERPDLWSRSAGAPNFMLDLPEGVFYGLPAMDGLGLKVGWDNLDQPTTPQSIDREVHPEDIKPMRAVLDRYLPGASGPVQRTVTCMYTMTPDENFIIELHPEHPQIAYGAGFSGMGFKFSPVVGEILADLARVGVSRHDTTMFASHRFRRAGTE